MNSQNYPHSNSNPGIAIARDVDATLRLIANLPAPEGLEDRVLGGLYSAPRPGRVLRWPGENWLRTAAAAVIVFVIVGGGWEISSHVQSGSAIAMPAHFGASGGFSNAGAVRVPQTVPAPIIAPSATGQPTEMKPSKNVRSKANSHQIAKGSAVSKVPSVPAASQNPELAVH